MSANGPASADIGQWICSRWRDHGDSRSIGDWMSQRGGWPGCVRAVAAAPAQVWPQLVGALVNEGNRHWMDALRLGCHRAVAEHDRLALVGLVATLLELGLGDRRAQEIAPLRDAAAQLALALCPTARQPGLALLIEARRCAALRLGGDTEQFLHASSALDKPATLRSVLAPPVPARWRFVVLRVLAQRALHIRGGERQLAWLHGLLEEAAVDWGGAARNQRRLICAERALVADNHCEAMLYLLAVSRAMCSGREELHCRVELFHLWRQLGDAVEAPSPHWHLPALPGAAQLQALARDVDRVLSALPEAGELPALATALTTSARC